MPWKARICTLLTFTRVNLILPSAISFAKPVVLHCEGPPIHFSEINIQNIRVVCSKALILYGGFPLKKPITRVKAMKVHCVKRVNLRIQSEYRKIRTSIWTLSRSITFHAHDNLIFPFTRNTRINIQKKFIFKTNSKIKYVVENINKAKMKILTERDLLLLIILRRRKREKKTLSAGETSLLRK